MRNMEIELIEIRDFLASHHPFDLLPASELDALPRSLELSYARRDKQIYSSGSENAYLFIIRTGAVEVRDEADRFLSRRGEGEAFGSRSLLRGHTLYNVTAIEDTLLYKLPKYKFRQLCEQHDGFAYYYHADGATRLHNAVNPQSSNETGNSVNLMTLQIRDLVTKNFVKLPLNTSISEAARQMIEMKASSILICDENELAGIVTERDMCIRCLASGMDANTPISEIMTPGPYTISQDDYAFYALMVMSRRNIRHLPVKDKDQVVGVISATDLIQRQSASPVYIVGDIFRQSTVEQLAEVSSFIPQVLVNLVEADATAHSIGHIISSIGDAVTSQLLQLAEERLGEPPVPYCWLSFGSLARMEQSVQSDQDNALLLSDEYDAAQHGEYFEKLAQFVNEGMDACGYEYCPGEIMASNSKWRQPLGVWKNYFSNWINKPEPKALMHASIFFDMRRIHGDRALFKDLHGHVLQQSKSNRIFLAHLTANALHLEPPLGFFRRFVLVHDGEHNNTVDLKHNGVVPIIDLSRIYALAGGFDAVNTRSRLEVVAGNGEVSKQGAEDLRDALELISMARLRHQVRLINAGKTANNFIPPNELSNFERNHLKDAFEIVRTMQDALGQRYQSGRF